MEPKERINVNGQLAELMNRAADPVDMDDSGRLRPRWLVPVQLWSWLYPMREGPDYVISQLDVWVRWPDGRECYESFGDLGNGWDEALAANLASFRRCSLPVLWGACNGREPDQHWELNGQRYGVYLGDVVMKGLVDSYLVPPDWLEFIRAELARAFADPANGALVAGEWHFVRCYHMHRDSHSIGYDFLLNGQPLAAAEARLQRLDWISRAEGYSVRQFLLLRRLAD